MIEREGTRNTQKAVRRLPRRQWWVVGERGGEAVCARSEESFQEAVVCVKSEDGRYKRKMR
jgi:hypothetical protein